MKLTTRAAIGALAATLAAPAIAHDPQAHDDPVIYTNTEDAYFAEEEEREKPDWIALRIGPDAMHAIDAFGEKSALPEGLSIVNHGPDTVTATLNGIDTELRRARPATCWAAVRKADAKEGETGGFHFERGLALYDQGGRVSVGGGDSGAPEIILRMRRVTWAKGSSNRPSLVLYVHTPEGGERAVSYAWADYDASRVGVNLRWMQASCGIDGAESD